jgi:uncharacterized protein (TIGR02246 family)
VEQEYRSNEHEGINMNRLAMMILAATLAGLAAGPVNAESPRDEIEAALVTFAAAFNKGDDAGVAAHYAEDAAVLPPDSARVDGRANIQAFWKGAIDAGFADLTLKAVEVGSSGDMAFEVGEVSFSAPDKTGARSTVTGKYIVVWKKSADGVWRLYRDIWNANPAK